MSYDCTVSHDIGLAGIIIVNRDYTSRHWFLLIRWTFSTTCSADDAISGFDVDMAALSNALQFECMHLFGPNMYAMICVHMFQLSYVTNDLVCFSICN